MSSSYLKILLFYIAAFLALYVCMIVNIFFKLSFFLFVFLYLSLFCNLFAPMYSLSLFDIHLALHHLHCKLKNAFAKILHSNLEMSIWQRLSIPLFFSAASMKWILIPVPSIMTIQQLKVWNWIRSKNNDILLKEIAFFFNNFDQ